MSWIDCVELIRSDGVKEAIDWLYLRLQKPLSHWAEIESKNVTSLKAHLWWWKTLGPNEMAFVVVYDQTTALNLLTTEPLKLLPPADWLVNIRLDYVLIACTRYAKCETPFILQTTLGVLSMTRTEHRQLYLQKTIMFRGLHDNLSSKIERKANFRFLGKW